MLNAKVATRDRDVSAPTGKCCHGTVISFNLSSGFKFSDLIRAVFVDAPNCSCLVRAASNEPRVWRKGKPLDWVAVPVLHLERFWELCPLSVRVDLGLQSLRAVKQQLFFGVDAAALVFLLLLADVLDVVVEQLRAFDALAVRDLENRLDKFTFLLVFKHIVGEVCQQLVARDLCIEELLHSHVEAAVKVLVGIVDGLGPQLLRLLELLVEESYTSAFV